MIDSAGFPEEYKTEASAGAAFLQALLQEQQLDWTFVSPSAEFVEGERSGTFRLGQDHLLETPKHSRQRFTIEY
ncbi:NAD-dependent epimerase/dehydratase [Pseudomonas fluorescens]|uniref:NAD-dependent epimerase/dehydratase n=1 Tax=Pseudomonas fluorescens TaxID=294 RepID=A0A3S4T3C1_PSEFL|nr:NAD-dependent epimerase/dehydratase [Pseudomonas fluorescens]